MEIDDRGAQAAGCASLTVVPDLPPPIALRRSITLCAATAMFGLVAAAAVYTSVAPYCGAVSALLLAVLVWAALMLIAIVQARKQPVALALTHDRLSALANDGRVLFDGRIASGSQWLHWLLILNVQREGDATLQPLVIAADALPADAFRELAVRATHGAR